MKRILLAQEGSSFEPTLQRLEALYPKEMQKLSRREDLRGKYVLLDLGGGTFRFVDSYDELPVDILTLEPDLAILKMPENPETEGINVRKISGDARWKIRNLFDEFRPSTSIRRSDGLILIPDDSQLSGIQALEWEGVDTLPENSLNGIAD